MKFDEWFNGIEVYSLRSERFYDDLDHHKEGSEGSYNRMAVWLKAAYEAGHDEALSKIMDDGK